MPTGEWCADSPVRASNNKQQTASTPCQVGCKNQTLRWATCPLNFMFPSRIVSLSGLQESYHRM